MLNACYVTSHHHTPAIAIEHGHAELVSRVQLDMRDVQTAKQLAEAVIPNEYGIDPPQKLRIGSKICNALLGKLLADLANMKDESLATAVSSDCSMRRDVQAVFMTLTMP